MKRKRIRYKPHCRYGDHEAIVNIKTPHTWVRQHERDTGQHDEAITLSQQDFDAFLTALDTPVRPAPALQRAFQRHNEQVRSMGRGYFPSR